MTGPGLGSYGLNTAKTVTATKLPRFLATIWLKNGDRHAQTQPPFTHQATKIVFHGPIANRPPQPGQEALAG